MRFLRRARRRQRDDRGFTLLETVIAITLLAGVFVSAGAVFSRMLIGTLYSRQNQQAADVISEEIEALRSQSFAALAMNATDVTGDPNLVMVSGVPYYDPDGSGSIAREPIVTAAGGVVNPHIETVTRNSTRYTLARWVTDPRDPTGKYRRVTVLATWTNGRRSFQRRASTFVTMTRRGLPLPNFTLASPVTKTVNRGTPFDLPVTLTNRGATDSWNLSASTDGGWTWTTTWYKDNGDVPGKYDANDTALVDTDGDGRVETGLLGTDQAIALVARVQFGGTEPDGTVVHHTLRAQSVAQPNSSTGVETVVETITVKVQSCPGCTFRTFYLHNKATTGDSTRQVNMPIDQLLPTQTSLPNFDTDVDAVAGRKLTVGGTNATTTGSGMANWRYQVPAKTTYSGPATLTFWARSNADTTKQLGFTVYVNVEGGSTYTQVATATATVSGSSGFQQVDVPITLSSVTVTNNKRFEIKVVAMSGTGYDDAILAYDVKTLHEAIIVMPFVS